jgi:hypothetical protein
VALALLAAVALKTGDDARREFARLATELAAVVQAEARLQADGDLDSAEAYLDPDAPRDWAQRYRRLYDPTPVNPYNELCGVYGTEWHPQTAPPEVSILSARDEAAGRRVRLALTWPVGSRAGEERAYRWVGGRWRRTPLTDAERTHGRELSRQVGEVVITGPAGDVAALTADPALAIDFAALDRRVRGDLAGVMPTRRGGQTATTQVVLRPTELEGPVIETGIAPQRLVLVNAPSLALVNPDGPLLAAALYRLALVQAVLGARYSQVGVTELPFAPYWSLSADERLALRNRLRQALGGQWRSQLVRDPDPAAAIQMRYSFYDEWQRRCLSDALLVQQLLETGRVSSIGDLVTRFDRERDSGKVLLGLSGQPDRARYDDWARTWATTPEP